MRNACFAVLRSVAVQGPWGMGVLFGYSGFMQFLADRTTEQNSERQSKEWKFALVEAVAHSPSLKSTPEANEEAVKAVLHQGPWFMPPGVAGPQLM